MNQSKFYNKNLYYHKNYNAFNLNNSVNLIIFIVFSIILLPLTVSVWLTTLATLPNIPLLI